MKKISVIIPCYNVENYIDRCIESIIGQSIGLDSLEIICINDCSTDATLEHLKQWEAEHSDSIILIDCDENMGLGKARNVGLEYAGCKYVAFIDSDDWIEPDYFSRMYSEALLNDCQVVSCGFIRDESTLLKYNENDAEEAFTFYSVTNESERKSFFHEQSHRLYAWGKLIKKSFLVDNNILFPEHLAYEDVTWGNKVHMCLEKSSITKRNMYHYFIKQDSLVLKKNAVHHIDHLTINELLWDMWTQDDLFEKYADELVYEYYYNAYLATLKIIVYRFEKPPYSLFMLLQEQICSKIPQRYECEYLSKERLPELHYILIDLLYSNIDVSMFEQICSMIRTIGL